MLEISCNHAAAHITTTHAYIGVPSQVFLFTAKAPESHDGTLGGSPKTGIVGLYRPCVV